MFCLIRSSFLQNVIAFRSPKCKTLVIAIHVIAASVAVIKKSDKVNVTETLICGKMTSRPKNRWLLGRQCLIGDRFLLSSSSWTIGNSKLNYFLTESNKVWSKSWRKQQQRLWDIEKWRVDFTDWPLDCYICTSLRIFLEMTQIRATVES